MIFVTVGTARGDFQRLIKAIDELAAEGLLANVTAQIGKSSYEPAHCKFSRYLSRCEISAHIAAADFVICHGGVATLEECLARQKKVIVAPRLARHDEAADDHQMEITSHLAAQNRLLVVTDMSELRRAIEKVWSWQAAFPICSVDNSIVSRIRRFMDGDSAKNDKGH